MLKLNKTILVIIIIAGSFIVFSRGVYATCGTNYGIGGSGGSGGIANGGTGGTGTTGNCGITASGGGGGGGGGGSAAGGTGSNGAGGTVVLKNTSGSMTISGTIDARGGSSSTTNGGTVKLFYTGSAPSTAGVTAGRTYSAAATTQQSQVCVPSIASDNSSTGSVAWSTPAGAEDQDNNEALAGPASATTHYLVLTGCNFAIPSGANVTGVRVDFLKETDVAASDNAVRLVKGGVIQTTDRSNGGWDSAGYRWDTYGGASDLWGTTLTGSDVGSSSFGVALSASLSFTSNAFVDSTHITVYYAFNSPPSTPTLSAPAAGATGILLTPTFGLSSTDADGDYIQYRLYLYQSDCSTAVGSSPFTQSSSQTGWSGQNADLNLAYSSGSAASYTYQGTLSGNTVYCWKADAIDPGGTNTYGSASATQTFTTVNIIPTHIQGGTNIRGGVKIR